MLDKIKVKIKKINKHILHIIKKENINTNLLRKRNFKI
jgi:hypothetical protein